MGSRRETVPTELSVANTCRCVGDGEYGMGKSNMSLILGRGNVRRRLEFVSMCFGWWYRQ